MTVCSTSSFSFSSSRVTSTIRSSSISANTATKRFRNQYNNNSNIMHNNYNKKSPRPMMTMIRTKFTNSSQKRLQRDDVINPSKATGAATTIRQQQQQQAKNQERKKRILTITAATTIAFFTINAFGTYTHYHDDLFTKYYPLPFALDVGIGYSMIPTLNPHMNEVYLRDTRRNIVYNKGDVVTIYNPYTENIVTKRIVGVEGDVICLYGEFAVEFSKLKKQRQLKQQQKEEEEEQQEQQQQQQQGECYGGGIPLDVRFDPPFCQKQHQQQQLSCENNTQYDATMRVPPNHVWVEGDNPLESTDSRHYGPLPTSALRGRVVLRLWPLMMGEHDNDDNDSSSNDKERRRSFSNEWFYRLSGERPNLFQEKEE